MPERGGTGRGNAPRRPGETRGGRAFAPIVVRAADGLTRWVTRVLGASATAGRESISEAELRDLVAANVVLSGEERRIIDEVLAAGARHVREVMVPRTDVVFLDAGLPLALAVAAVRTARHSRFPVIDGSHDDVIGFVHLRDLLNPEFMNKATPVRDACRPVKQLPVSKTILSALTEMRKDRAHLAIVIDEYGGTAGIVTLEDLVEELIGDIKDEYDVEAAQAQRLIGGQVDVDGLLNLDDFADETGIRLPEGPYETVAGYVIAALGALPGPDDAVEVSGYRLTVTEMDGRRVARIRVSPATDGHPQATPDRPAAGGRAGGERAAAGLESSRAPSRARRDGSAAQPPVDP